MTRTFTVHFEADVTIQLEDAVIGIMKGEDVAEHIAYYMITSNIRLSRIDGWADMPDSAAKIVKGPDWDVECIGEVTT